MVDTEGSEREWKGVSDRSERFDSRERESGIFFFRDLDLNLNLFFSLKKKKNTSQPRPPPKPSSPSLPSTAATSAKHCYSWSTEPSPSS